MTTPDSRRYTDDAREKLRGAKERASTGEDLHTELGDLISLNHDHRRPLGDAEVETLAEVITDAGYRRVAPPVGRGASTLRTGALLITHEQVAELADKAEKAYREWTSSASPNRKKLLPVVMDDDGDVMTWFPSDPSPFGERGWHWGESVMDSEDLSLPVRILKGVGVWETDS